MLFVIQHHPSRAALLPRLGLPEAVVVTDPEPSEPPGTWRTYRECLELAPQTGHLVVIQDDALPSPNLRRHLTALVAECPSAILVLFLSKQARWTGPAMLQASRDGKRFVCLNDRELFVPAVAICWPVDAARAVAKWADGRRWGHRAKRADDAILRDATKGLGLDVCVTVPSLVEHPGDVISLMDPRGREGRSRRALLPHPDIWGS